MTISGQTYRVFSSTSTVFVIVEQGLNVGIGCVLKTKIERGIQVVRHLGGLPSLNSCSKQVSDELRPGCSGLHPDGWSLHNLSGCLVPLTWLPRYFFNKISLPNQYHWDLDLILTHLSLAIPLAICWSLLLARGFSTVRSLHRICFFI